VEIAGRFVGNVTMIVGIVVFALPLAVIGSTFQSVWEAEKKETQANIRRKHANAHAGAIQKQIDKLDSLLKDLEKTVGETTDMIMGGIDKNLDERPMQTAIKTIAIQMASLRDHFEIYAS
jgi:hypothetical protein